MKYIFYLILLVSGHISNAQISIKGRCRDTTDNPVVSATVRLYQSGTTRELTNKLTDTSGLFFLKIDTSLSYFIQVEAVGFQLYTSKSIKINNSRGDYQIEDIILQHQITRLQNITVTATRNLITAANDKIVYNVEGDPSLNGLTTLDALGRVPFVSVDGLGNIQLKGQNNFRILLNGRPSSLFSNSPGEALKGFPANSVSKIEVITSPSAKYEGEGLSGVINIITQKKTIGLTGSTSFTYSNLQDGSVNPNNRISYRNGKLGINSFMYYAENLGFQTTGFNQFTSLNNSTVFRERKSIDTLRNRAYQYGGNLEIAYDIDSLQSISLYGVIFGNGSKRLQTNKFTLNNNAGNIVGSSDFITLDTAKSPGSEIGLDYIKKFANPDKEFSISVNRQFRSTVSNFFSDQNYSSGMLLFLKNNNNATNEQNTVQIDFVLPLQKGYRLDMGFNYIQRKVSSDFSSFYKNTINDPYLPNIGNNDLLQYDQNVYGGYFVANYQSKGLSINLGSRLERTLVSGDFISSQTSVQQDYLSWLPNANFNWKMKNNDRLHASYNRRLSRPNLTFLNPFIDNRDPFFLNFGNPYLEPEFSNNIELGFTGYKQKLSYSLNLTASYINNGIQRYFVFNESTGITRQTYGNVVINKIFSINGFLSYRPSQKLSYSMNYSVNYADFKNKIQSLDRNKGWYGSINHNINFTPSPRLFFFHSMNYTAAPLQLQGRNGNLLSYNIGAGYFPIPQKVVVSVGINNLFNETWSLKNSFSSFSFSQVNNVIRPVRSVSVTIRYNYGKLKQSVSRKKGIQIVDAKENVNSQ